ncbi:uncharacterized protein EI97DRAFT_442072 [Westerdykella ornata]|uniref:Uncharacterized protein n=1 Tax=Westerdykella ornata TaxID=318751 RepID=A0A6A6JM02_WESOR|nr:uncharacterized protein EI97DRAFT_442072 [Westerdykella ornata]KAF2276686.1 hypothetical protein EI97DRAFT_442072 [Westerdykella ornata]
MRRTSSTPDHGQHKITTKLSRAQGGSSLFLVSPFIKSRMQNTKSPYFECIQEAALPLRITVQMQNSSHSGIWMGITQTGQSQSFASEHVRYGGSVEISFVASHRSNPHTTALHSIMAKEDRHTADGRAFTWVYLGKGNATRDGGFTTPRPR